MRWLIAHLAIVAMVFCHLGCEGCGCNDSDVIAELVESSGDVRRDWSARKEQWTPVGEIERFSFGDGVRTQTSSSAFLKLNGGSRLLLKEKTQIRFQTKLDRPDAQKIVVEQGEAEIQVGDAAMELTTELGTARLEPHSKIALKRSDDGLGYRVLVGQARFFSGSDDAEIADAGEGLFIRFGSGVLEKIGEAASDFDGMNNESEGGDAGGSESNLDGVSFFAKGTGISARKPEQSSWVDIPAGSGRLPAGSTVRLPTDSNLELPRGEDRVTLYGPGEFHLGGDKEHFVRAASGRMALDAKIKPVTVLVPGGKIIALSGPESGTAAQVTLRKRFTRIDVERGEVQAIGADGERRSLLGGERMKLARIEASQTAPYEFELGPSRADFPVFAGESFVVHAAKPPVAVAFRFGDKCPGEGVVKIVGGKSRGAKGTQKAHLLLPRGRSRYELRCLDEDGGVQEQTAAKGQVLVLRDPGVSTLPRRAPESFVDADGRKYKIMYQNLLPEVTVRWPKAPAATSYRLVVSSKRIDKKSIPLKTPRHTFASGELKEGTHSMYFEATGGRVVSKPIAVQIRFDNAAPKGSVRQPAEGAFAPGQEVVVEGVVEPGWTVTADSHEITQDSSYRFSGTAQTSAQYDGLALKLTHPNRGVHYYLRRSHKVE